MRSPSPRSLLDPGRHGLVAPDEGALSLERLLQLVYRNLARKRIAR
jgi:hypothetical protein